MLTEISFKLSVYETITSENEKKFCLILDLLVRSELQIQAIFW